MRIGFRRDLDAGPTSTEPPQDDQPAAPVYALVVLAVTVVGFVAVTAVGQSPAWAAAAGVIALGVPALRQSRTTPVGLIAAAHLGFAAFVFALGVLATACPGMGSAMRCTG